MNERELLTHMLNQARRTAGPVSPETREENLRRLMRASMAHVEVSDALRERVMALEAPSRARRQFSLALLFPGRSGRWVMAAALAAACIVTGIVVQPTWVAAQALRRMEAAITDVRSAHEISWRVAPDGRRTKAAETWYQAGQWRLEDFRWRRVQVYTDGKLWTYEPEANKVTVWRAEGPFGYNRSGFSIAAVKRDFARWGWRDRIRLLGNTRIDGRAARLFALEAIRDPIHEYQHLLVVDAATDLPVRSELKVKTGGRWVIEAISEHQFNRPLPAKLFEPEFPKTAQVFDRDAGRQIWENRLARGIARQRVGDRTIVFRDVQVNAQGDVFLLYTAGKYPSDSMRTENYLAGRDWLIEMKDEFGTKYLWQQQNGNWTSLARQALGLPNSFVLNGERVEGDLWVPLTPQHPWKPRRFTITFRVNPVNLHGSYDDPEMKVSYTETAIITLPVSSPATVVVPDYMTYMGTGLQEWDIQRGRAHARAHYYRHEGRDLPRALEFYREVARANEDYSQSIGEPVRDSQLWTTVGDLLFQMGRKEEAREAFQRAVHESSPRDSSRQDAQRGLEALEADLAWSPGRLAPSVSAIDLNGRRQSTDQYRGQVLLIDLWSPWYGERGQKALYARYHSKGLAILGVGIGPNKRSIEQFVKEQQIPWPQLVDDLGYRTEIGGRFGYSHAITQLPRTILIDRRGVVRHVNLKGKALEKAVAELLAAKP